METSPRWRGRTLYLGNASAGIDMAYIKSRKVLCISGWFDHMVGVEGGEIPLSEFLTGLGITLKDCVKAMNKEASMTQELAVQRRVRR